MMGYKASKKIYKLKFVDEEMEGLEVRACSPSTGEFFEISKLADFANKNITAEDLEQIMPFFDLFIKCIISWNLEDDEDVAVPISREGLMSQDLPFIFVIIDAWMKSVASVSAPLAQPSQDGEQFPVGLIPMETLSLNQAS